MHRRCLLCSESLGIDDAVDDHTSYTLECQGEFTSQNERRQDCSPPGTLESNINTDYTNMVWGLTIHEPSPNQCAVRYPDEVDRSVRTIECVRHSDHIPYRCGSTEILQRFAARPIQAHLFDLSVLVLHSGSLRQECLYIGRVSKVARFLDTRELDRAVEQLIILFGTVEAVHFAGASATIKWGRRCETSA